MNCTVVLVGSRGIVDREGYRCGRRKRGGTLVNSGGTVRGVAEPVIVEVD